MYEKDMWIWVDHPIDVWQPAKIIETSKSSMKVSSMSGEIFTITKKKIWSVLSIGSYQEDMQNKDICKDLSKMNSLSTESVLHCLKIAYDSEIYYSNLGAGTVLAVNPFRDVKGLFSDEKVYQYHLASHTEFSKMPAHVFSVAERSLRYMLGSMEKTCQSIIISGESGAGKTWTVRYLMRYLAVVGMETSPSVSESGDFARIGMKLSDSLIGDQIEHRILSSNPILEAFGNAATPRNHNSSRFGKYIQLQYDRCGSIVGALLRVYLLEKTRVTNHGNSERPYHIFSQMINGSTAEEKLEWLLPETVYLQPEEKLNFNTNNNLNVSNDSDISCEGDTRDDNNETVINVMDNADAFVTTCNALQSVGISTKMQSKIFKILSAILHLERMSFDGADDLSTPCTISPSCRGNVENASVLLSVPIISLVQAITVREIKAGKSAERRRSVFERSCTRDECSSRRDALMKYLYERLFIWLVGHIGNDLAAPPDQACSFIGLLDVYGFESFQHNGLEQLCINYANEKLQQYYVKNFLKLQQLPMHVVWIDFPGGLSVIASRSLNIYCCTLGLLGEFIRKKWLHVMHTNQECKQCRGLSYFVRCIQEELAAEGVQWEGLDLTCRIGCLSVLESTHNSLFALLNEECRLNRSSNPMQLKDRISEHFCENSFISPPRISSDIPCFSVLHYAGTVSYETGSLITKNKDELPLEIARMLLHSKSDFIPLLISDKVKGMFKRTGAKGKFHDTVLTEFKKSLDDLLKSISSTNCHYIRCIKPNRLSLPSNFDSFHVVDQLRSSGVVETVQICGHLHPHRMSYDQFISHFEFILRHNHNVRSPTHQNWFKEYDYTQQTCDKILSLVSLDNPHLDRSKSWKFGKTFVFLSSVLYEILERERSKEMTRSATMIQLAWLSYCHKKRCIQLLRRVIAERHRAATLLQSVWKAKLHLRKCAKARKTEIYKRNNAACVLQRTWSNYVARQTKNKELLLERERLKDVSQLIPPNVLKVHRVFTQYAEIKKATIERKADSSKLRDSSPEDKAIDWVCRPKHNLIERYFPSMMLMDFCRVCTYFLGPLDLITDQYDIGGYRRSLKTTYQGDYNPLDVSIETNLSCTDIPSLSPHSFTLNDTSLLVEFQRHTSILPFADVKPKHDVSLEF